MIRSIRGRLLLALLLAGTLVLGLLCAAIYVSVRHTLRRSFDARLFAHAQAVMAMTEQDNGKIRLDFDEQTLPEFQAQQAGPGERAYFEIHLDDGEYLGRSPSLEDAHLSFPPTVPGDPIFTEIILPNGAPARCVSCVFTPAPEPVSAQSHPAVAPKARRAVIVAALDAEELNETLVVILARMSIVGGAALLIAPLLAVWIIRRSLRPLSVLAGRIDALHEGQTGQRVALEQAPSELEPVVATLNSLLVRMDAAMTRERGFTADVAHELRTPLTALRTTLEVSQGRVRTPEEYAATIQKCVELGNNVQGMIETLLIMARADAGQLIARPRPLDLIERVDEWFIPFAPRAAARHLTVNWELPERRQVLTDPELLQIVINNLFDNAVSYANEGGVVTIHGVAEEGDHFRLKISNTGCTLAPADAERVFDRFWRGDSSRSDIRRHHGLGLSLSRQAADLLGHTLGVEISPDGQFSVSLAFG